MLKKYALLVFPLLILICFRFGFNFNGLYGQDAYEYLRYAERLKDFLLAGIPPGDYFWPIGYPLYGAILSFVTVDISLALQLISTLALTGTIWYGNKLLDLFFPDAKGKGLYLFLFLLLSPFLLRSSLLCMSDTGALFFITAFFYHAFSFKNSGSKVDLSLLFFFAANAFMFRYVSLVLLVIPSIYMLPDLLKKKQIVPCIIGLVLFTLFLSPHFLIRNDNPVSFLNHQWLSGWSFSNYFQSSFATADGQYQGTYPNLLYSLGALFHPGNFIFGIPFLFLMIFRKLYSVEEKILVVAVLVYVLFLAGMPIQNLRFYLLPLPLLVIGSFRGFIFVVEKSRTFIHSVLILIVFVFQCSMFVIGFKKVYLRNQLEVSIKSWISQYTKQSSIYSFDMDVSLKSGGLDRVFYNLWEKKYESFESNSLVLFNESAFEKQWKGKNPMINWEKLNSDYELELVKTFPGGWNLYEIK